MQVGSIPSGFRVKPLFLSPRPLFSRQLPSVVFELHMQSLRMGTICYCTAGLNVFVIVTCYKFGSGRWRQTPDLCWGQFGATGSFGAGVG